MVIRNKGSGKKLQRYYGSVNTQMGKTLEKLSSGYRINRAGDDAAGLAVSEKMRLQITGLGRAKENSREGTKLIQTGEGALQEIQSMLDRAEYLAGESANGTYMDELDRENLQKELDHLCSEIDRIAESANFNGIELFQNRGVEYESSAIDPRLVKFRQELEKAQSDWEMALEKKRLDALPKPSIADPERWPDVSTALPAGKMTLEELKRNTKPGEFNIVYIEHDFETTQTGSSSDSGGTYTTGVGTGLDLTVDETGGKKLSEILEKEIVPNIVQNLLDNYPAFSYLTGSSIGIGLRLYDESSNTLASVKGGVSTANLQTYMLSVNINSLKDGGTVSKEDRVKLESTIAHEMMHAFMDEATTNGMFGYTGSSFDSSAAFPEWFIEGMAQTASGPGNWVKASGGLGINKDTSEADIIAAIKRTNNQLKTDTGTSRYGTGYLACMYLGAAISAYQADGNLSNVDKADSASISNGLKLLLSNVIQGKSLDKAISELTGGSFSSTKDFQDKFDDGSAAGMAPFIKQLLTQTGDGLGGLATGDLTHKDLADDKPLTIKLFQLDTTAPIVSNKYPDDHKVLTGGTTSTDGTAPVELTVPKEYGDFMVEGPDLSGVSFNAATGTLTVSGDNIRISMKTTGAPTTQNIVLNSGGTVTLDGVSTSGAVDIKGANTKIKTTGKNAVGNVNLATGVNVTFDGTGQLKTSPTFNADSSNTINCNGGALIVGIGGSGNMGGAKVTVNGASVAASLTGNTDSAGKAECQINRAVLTKLPENITSITVGGTKTDMLLSSSDPTCLWLDKKEGPAGMFGTQKVTFSGTNAAGEAVSQAYLVQWDDTKKEFVFDPFNVFTVTGGTEGTDYYFDAGTNTLKILTNAPLTISGGTKEIDGKTEYGTIEIADGVKSTITLDGVQIDATKIGGNTAGILLGNGSDIKLTMKGENTIIGSGESAGIQFFGDYKKDSTSVALEDSSLHIDMTSGSKLTAKGGTVSNKGGAGIGTAWATDSSKSSIKITGEGTLDIKGGNGGAGIGGSEGGDLGNITIDGSGLIIKSVGGYHGAGIGAGGWVSNYSNPADQKVGNITITGTVDINASSEGHGTGIGSACHSGVGDITIGKPPAGPGNDGIKIYTQGGNDGAAIGSGWSGTMGTLTIWGGTIDAEAGSQGAGIGSGWQADGGDIVIKGGTITATGKTSSSGIGSGLDGNVSSVTIEGGTITAKGGWTNNGGNIGGFDKDGNEIKVSVPDPEKVEIKAGPGEGLYVTTGTFDGKGNQLYALDLKYISELLKKSTIASVPTGSAGLSFPVDIKATLKDGTSYGWDDLQHKNVKKGSTSVAVEEESDAYIWMKGNDVTLEISYTGEDGKDYTVKVDLKFFDEYGLWRYDATDLPDEKPVKPEPKPPAPTPTPTPTPNPPSPAPPVEPTVPVKGRGGIILQIGANYGEILEVPQFYLSTYALGLDKISIATQDRALHSMAVLRHAINRVSAIRGDYGALQNRLEYNINNLGQSVENMADAESRIRDADMAEEYTRLVKLNILQQSAQAMIAQNNQDANRVLQLLQ